MRGIERGIERTGVKPRVVAYVEIEAFIVQNLVAQMESGLLDPAPIWSNLKTFPMEGFRNKVHGIIGGYPCQPFSNAGRRGGPTTLVTCGPILKKWSDELLPIGASSKMFRDILPSDSKESSENWKSYTTKLRQEYSQRQKLAHLTKEKDFLSSQSETESTRSTPRVGGQEGYKTRLKRGKDLGLQGQVELLQEQNWATPQASEADKERGTKFAQGGTALSLQVKNWPTPAAHEARLGFQDRSNGKKGSQESLTTIVIKTDGLPLPDKHNKNLNTRVLNPNWVLQLMGTTIEKTFFAWREMESSSRQPN